MKALWVPRDWKNIYDQLNLAAFPGDFEIGKSSGNAAIAAGHSGLEAQDATASGWGGNTNTPAKVRVTGDFTLMWLGTIRGNGVLSNNPPLIAAYHNGSNTAPFISWGFIRRNTASTTLGFTYNDGTNLQIYDATSAITLNEVVMFTATRQVGGNTTIYKNGVQAAQSATAAGTIAYGASSIIWIGRHVTTSDFANAGMNMAAIWNRVLAPAEVAQLAFDPGQIVRNRPSIFASAVSFPAWKPQIIVC